MGPDARIARGDIGVTRTEGRAWGFWTKAKLQMLEEYLGGFAKASKSQTERVYLDAFAGEGHGLDRITGERFHGSARIALDAGEDAGFTVFRYFEMGQKATELQQRLRAEYPGKDIKVYAGDCNEKIPEALADLASVKWAPTFAFLDPDGMELEWRTLKALADHKRGYRKTGSEKPEYKVEMWMLFPTSGIIRTLALDEAKVTEQDFARASRLFGSKDWKPIYEQRRAGEFSAAEARDEYVNLMRWRLEKALGYRAAHAFELKNSKGPLYHMIFATDNEVGTRIMSAIYGNAAKQLPEMRREAKDRAVGQGALDFGDAHLASNEGYRYEPPWEPPALLGI